MCTCAQIRKMERELESLRAAMGTLESSRQSAVTSAEDRVERFKKEVSLSIGCVWIWLLMMID